MTLQSREGMRFWVGLCLVVSCFTLVYSRKGLSETENIAFPDTHRLFTFRRISEKDFRKIRGTVLRPIRLRSRVSPSHQLPSCFIVRKETVEVAKEKRLIVKEKIIRKDKDLEWGKVNYYQFLGYWVNPLSKCIYEVVRFWSHPMARMEGRYDSAMMKLIRYGILFFSSSQLVLEGTRALSPYIPYLLPSKKYLLITGISDGHACPAHKSAHVIPPAIYLLTEDPMELVWELTHEMVVAGVVEAASHDDPSWLFQSLEYMPLHGRCIKDVKVWSVVEDGTAFVLEVYLVWRDQDESNKVKAQRERRYVLFDWE